MLDLKASSHLLSDWLPHHMSFGWSGKLGLVLSMDSCSSPFLQIHLLSYLLVPDGLAYPPISCHLDVPFLCLL